MSAQTSPAAIGDLYDKLSSPFEKMMGGAMHSGYWESATSPEDMVAASDRMTTQVANRLRLGAPGQRILDIGCGSGKPAAQIAAHSGAHVTGITVSNVQVEMAQKQYRDVKPGSVTFQFADVADMPFADGSFDGAYAMQSLCHLEDRKKAFAQIARVLKRGGHLVIFDHYLKDAAEANTPALQAMGRAFRLPSYPKDEEWRTLLKENGFELVEFVDVQQNVLRAHEIMVQGFGEVDLPEGDEVGDACRALAALAKESGAFDMLYFAIITAVRRG